MNQKFSFMVLLAGSLTLFAIPANALRLPAHLSYGYYELSKPGPFDNLEMTVTWKQASPPPEGMGYYAMYMFYFENKKGGYTGLQWDKKGTKAIFSIWDGPGGKMATPEGSCRRFDNEGDGASCIIPFAWTLNREYRLQVQRIGQSELGVRWQGSVVDSVSGQETLIGTILLGNDPSGYGGLSNQSTSVLEYYGRGDPTCADLPVTIVQWHGPFAQEGQVSSKRVRAWYPTPNPKKDEKTPITCINTNIGSPAINQVEHKAGGDTIRTTPHDKTIRWK